MKTLVMMKATALLSALVFTGGGFAQAATSPVLAASMKSTSAVSSSSASFEHMRALDLALNGENAAALKILMRLVEGESAKTTNTTKDEQDRIWLSIGRTHYQNGSFKDALSAYGKVRKGGPSWFEAMEEKAWVHLQLDEPNEALAQLKTVLSPLFKERASSEPFFAASIAQLRICDYKALYQTLDLFKERFRARAKSWEASSDPAAKARLRELSDTIQKMNVVEAEAIQRMYIDENKNNSGSAPKIAKKPGELSFPHVEGEEVWLDEVDDFRVSVKGCPQKGRSL